MKKTVTMFMGFLAAGTAAAIALESGKNVKDIDIETLQAKLREAGACIE